MKKFLMVFLTVIFLSGISINTFAASIKSADNLFCGDAFIDENLNVEGDVYAAGNMVNLSGNVEGDVITAGNTININVENIGGNIRAAGATINVNSKSAKNITAAGETINIKEGIDAKGVYLTGGNTNFLGKCEDLFIAAGNVTFNGSVSGNVEIDANEVVIGKDAKVDGTIKIKSSKEPKILGDFDKDKIEFELIKTKEDSSYFSGVGIVNKILSLITALIISALLTLICKKYLLKIEGYLKEKTWLCFLIGLGVLVLVPIASIILCITVVGIPIGIIALIIYGILIYLAPVISGIISGRLIFKDMNIYLSALICTAIIKVIIMIPYLGGILTFACILFSLGVFAQNIVYTLKTKE